MDGATDSDSDESVNTELAAGPDFVEFAKQLAYDKSINYETNREFYYPYTSIKATNKNINTLITSDSIPADSFASYGNSKFESARKEVTTLFMIDSKDRDHVAYPQPTKFTLKPPRIYKNVVNIQIAQLKLLTSFYYFSKSKGNTVLPIIELGRSLITNYNGLNLTEVISIPEGTYAISDLLKEIQTQMNYTPLFYYFPNGIDDFIPRFIVNGDLSLNFNQPGDIYYDSLNKKYITNPSMTQIISYYWSSQYAGLGEYNFSQIKCAYYYPVLYEAVIDTNDTTVYPFLKLDLPSNLQGLIVNYSKGQTINYIIFNQSGLDDPIISYIIENNIKYLNLYRYNHTFRTSLVNRYQLAYDVNNLRVNIYTNSLNTSLVNLINTTNSKSLTSVLSNLNLSSNAYSNLINRLGEAKVVFNDMYTYLQEQFTHYFAIDYYKYKSEYFTNSSNILFIQNGIDATNVISNINQFFSTGQSQITTYVTGYSNSPGFWPRFILENTSSANGIISGGIDLSGMANNISTSMYPYNVTSSNFLFTNKVIDENFYITTDKTTRSVNSLITIKPARYTVFKFKSPIRQTLEVETLPLPYYYRFADYNKTGSNLVGGNSNASQFDISYSFLYSSTGKYQNSLMDSSNYNTTVLSPEFQVSYELPSTVYSLNTVSNIAQFEFKAPYPPNSSGLVAYNTELSFVSLANSWPSTVQAYIYHDRAAFMADIQLPRQENSNHYIQSKSATTTTSTISSTITINFSTFAGNTYYAIFRSRDPTCPTPITYTPFIKYPISSFVEIKTDYLNFNPLANPYDQLNISTYPFVTNYNTDFLRLPVSSTLWGLDPQSSTFTNKVTVKNAPIGYDISGVSNDLTDYCGFIEGGDGFVPSTLYSIDPLNRYAFKSMTPFDTSINSYFNNRSQNIIINALTTERYYQKTTSSSQIKIVHWYDGYSIPRQSGDSFITSNAISSGTRSSLDYVKGFNTVDGNIQFGKGINAIGFLPTDGVYQISSFAFKSALYPTNTISTTTEDPNMNIKYIGVFSGAYLASAVVNLESALTVLKYTNSAVYSPSTIKLTPSFKFGSEYGTWYQYTIDPSFSSFTTINGYTQGANELLSYNSMYYMVPFNSSGSNITYSLLAGSAVPYPLSQVISTGSTYFGNTVTSLYGGVSQTNYCMPSTIANFNSFYGPKNGVAYTQSQYEQSQAITTTSLGYQSNGYLIRQSDALYNFSTCFTTAHGIIPREHVGLTTHFSEYNNSLYLVNSLYNNSTISNAPIGFLGASYASSISSVINKFNGTVSSIHFLLSTPSTLQNYTYTEISSYFSSITYQSQSGTKTSTTVVSYSFDVENTLNTTIWMWGGGGASMKDATISSYGGAGAYVKANIDVKQLYSSYNVSTVYMVVGKGGNRSNFVNTGTLGQGSIQKRYGGGGASVLETVDITHPEDSISLQGGGFSGIFLTSTLLQPILLVGGGGAGGASTLGGPGGFGSLLTSLPVNQYQFSMVTLTTSSFSTFAIQSINDIDSNTATDPVNSTIDGNFSTYWNPTEAFMNPNNFNPTPSTYRVNLGFGSNVSTIDRIKVSASSLTGMVIYNNSNKSQMLYSNTNLIPVSTIFTISSISTILTAPLVTNGWIVGGSSRSSTTMLQYSLDSSNWAEATNVGPSLPLNSTMSLVYASTFSKWFACGISSILQSSDGLTWGSSILPETEYPRVFNTLAYGDKVNTTNSTIIVAGGSETVSSGDGNNWYKSQTIPFLSGNISRIRYFNGKFWGTSIDNPGIIISVDGITWVYALESSRFSFKASDITYGNGIYVVSNVVIPGSSYTTSMLYYISVKQEWYLVSSVNLNTFTANTVEFGLQVFVAGGSTTDASSCIKYSRDAVNWFNANVSNTTQTINEIKFLNGSFIAVGHCPLGTGRAPNQRSILRSSDGINWSPILSGGFNSDLGDYAQSVEYGLLRIVPNVSTIYMELQATNPLYVYEIQAFKQSSIGSQTSQTGLSNLIDKNLATRYWPNEQQVQSIQDYSFIFNLSTPTKINMLEFYISSSVYFTGINIKNGPETLYSNSHILSDTFLAYNTSISKYTIPFKNSLMNISTLTIDISKTTSGSIQISQINPLYDENLDRESESSGGYSGGYIDTMLKSFVSYTNNYTGGGGQDQGGQAGKGGLNGQSLAGGSPGIAGNQSMVKHFSSIIHGAGGGGGGYHGGGGGGSTINGIGGAGGGGSGYIDFSVITLNSLDYATAIPGTSTIQNYRVPGLTEQNKVLSANMLPLYTYGQGGVGSSNGQGQDGLILINTEFINYISPLNNSIAYPQFIDGTKLTLFQVPIPKGNVRTLNFTTYSDSIQDSSYSNYNWVWYQSYLLLIGSTLSPYTMTASALTPSFPYSEFPNLPLYIYNIIEGQFSNVSTFFGGNRSNPHVISDSMAFALSIFQNDFSQISYTSSKYVEMTEIYGLLDYLQKPGNLVNPHIDPNGSQFDRVFGGVPRFGYWANPFLTNVSYIGFDIGPSQWAHPSLTAITGSSNSVTAMYGLVLEQCLSTGIYTLKDIMAYKPTAEESKGTNWYVASQFTESYVIRPLSNIPVQPFTVASAISGKLPLFNYKVYATPVTVGTNTFNAPIHMINDFQGTNLFTYTFQNTTLDDVSTISLVSQRLTSTIVNINQITVQNQANQPVLGNKLIGTLVSEYATSSITQAITQFGFDSTFKPIMNFSSIHNNFINTSLLSGQSVGKAIYNYNGTLYAADRSNNAALYENICTSQIYMGSSIKYSLNYTSPRNIVGQYLANQNVSYDFFQSKYTSIWHLQGTSNLSTIFGARLDSQYDLTNATYFVNQIFYPAHKIILTKVAAGLNPMFDLKDLSNYPSYPRTQMFYYKNYSSLMNDISGQFALEKTSNFAYSDTNSGYFLNSYINNINMKATDGGTDNDDSYNYLAIRAYSPSETFQSLVRFYLPGRYDFGYVSIQDIIDESKLNTALNINPDYQTILNEFNRKFSTTRLYGGTGFAGFYGSTIKTSGFENFLEQYKFMYSNISTNSVTLNNINAFVLQGQSTLVNYDLSTILPDYIATRQRVTDPLEFSLPFSSFNSFSNNGSSGSNTSVQYGMGYNLGYAKVDTPYYTVQRAESFFKILDDYIYMKMNPEYNMNRLDISRQEDFSATKDPVSEPQLYNCKLLLNTFGSYSTTFIQNPVVFNPPIGKLDMLSFSWYDSNGNLIDNAECDWSASFQIVERVDLATNDSTATRPI